MKQRIVSLLALIMLALPAVSGAQNSGKADFEQFCSGCHPQGGNPINPAKTLRKMDREANGIKTAADIVKVMRKPGQGMRSYTKKELSDKRAKAIANYVMKTF